MRVSKPSIGADSYWSSALPCGTPSMTSTRTTVRASSFSARRCAAVAPTLPAPTTVTLFITVVRSPSAGVHLAMGIRAQRVDPIQRSTIRHAEPLFSPAIGATLPRSPNQRGQLLVGRPAAEALAEIDSRPGVETQEPRAVRGDAAAVAGAAKRRGDGRDDPERCPVRKAEALRRSGAMARNRLDSAVTPRERVQHLLLGYDLLAGPACRAA